MDNSERNIHFQGFAKLLWDEISHNLRFLDFGFNPEQQASIDNHVREIIAQRAYDLVFFLSYEHPQEIEAAQWGGPSDDEIHRHIASLPDLTEWPTPPGP